MLILPATTTSSQVRSQPNRGQTPPTEWRILDALVTNPDVLITSRDLLTRIRADTGHTDPSYLRTYMSQLRRKLEADPSRPRHLLTDPGLGYRYRP